MTPLKIKGGMAAYTLLLQAFSNTSRPTFHDSMVIMLVQRISCLVQVLSIEMLEEGGRQE